MERIIYFYSYIIFQNLKFSSFNLGLFIVHFPDLKFLGNYIELTHALSLSIYNNKKIKKNEDNKLFFNPCVVSQFSSKYLTSKIKIKKEGLYSNHLLNLKNVFKIDDIININKVSLTFNFNVK